LPVRKQEATAEITMIMANMPHAISTLDFLINIIWERMEEEATSPVSEGGLLCGQNNRY
jgi:hypothetical protein